LRKHKDTEYDKGTDKPGQKLFHASHVHFLLWQENLGTLFESRTIGSLCSSPLANNHSAKEFTALVKQIGKRFSSTKSLGDTAIFPFHPHNNANIALSSGCQ
jgi:hypothetical protein